MCNNVRVTPVAVVGVYRLNDEAKERNVTMRRSARLAGYVNAMHHAVVNLTPEYTEQKDGPFAT
jgi:hypothetical protein